MDRLGFASAAAGHQPQSQAGRCRQTNQHPETQFRRENCHRTAFSSMRRAGRGRPVATRSIYHPQHHPPLVHQIRIEGHNRRPPLYFLKAPPLPSVHSYHVQPIVTVRHRETIVSVSARSARFGSHHGLHPWIKRSPVARPHSLAEMYRR